MSIRIVLYWIDGESKHFPTQNRLEISSHEQTIKAQKSRRLSIKREKNLVSTSSMYRAKFQKIRRDIFLSIQITIVGPNEQCKQKETAAYARVLFEVFESFKYHCQ